MSSEYWMEGGDAGSPWRLPDPGDAQTQRQYLTFYLDGGEYAFDIRSVRELRAFIRPSPVPGTADYVRGVITVRDRILPVVDLRERLGLPVSEYGRTTTLIVLQREPADREEIGEAAAESGFAVVVDNVGEVCSMDPDRLRETPALSEHSADFVAGMIDRDGQLIILLRVDTLLCEEFLAEIPGLATLALHHDGPEG